MHTTIPSTIRGLAIAALATALPTIASAQTIDVHFPRGASGTTIEGSIKGREAARYRLGVSAGQRMSVQLDTDNTSNYFNITAPGTAEALFNGSISGNGTSFLVPSSGKYIIDVYLMRNAARRNETANYALTFYVENAAPAGEKGKAPGPSAVSPPSNPAPDAVSTELMPRYCAGEASAEFSVRPQEITTNPAFKSGNRYVVQGYFDQPGGTKFFNCWFGLDGSFQSIN